MDKVYEKIQVLWKLNLKMNMLVDNKKRKVKFFIINENGILIVIGNHQNIFYDNDKSYEFTFYNLRNTVLNEFVKLVYIDDKLHLEINYNIEKIIFEIVENDYNVVEYKIKNFIYVLDSEINKRFDYNNKYIKRF